MTRTARLSLLTLLFGLALVAQSAPLAHANVPCNLISWWPFDGSPSDIRGSNPGSVVGAGTYPPAIVAAGWKNAGPGSLITVLNAQTLDFSQSTLGFSLDVWLRIDHINVGNMFVVWKGKGGQDITSPYYIVVQGTNAAADPPGTVYFSVANGVQSQYLKSPTPLATGIFTHVTATADGVKLTLYINGAPVASTAQTVKPYNSPYPLQIGGSVLSPNSFFNGVIDELELFNRALDPTPRSEIAAIYQAGSGGKCK
jgi:hypothetical protein